MNCTDALARPGIAQLDVQAITFAYNPHPPDPFTVFWDTTAVSRHLRSQNTQPVWLPLDGLEQALLDGRFEVDKEYAMSERVDPRIPILAIQFDDGRLPIDGWHRIYRAIKLGWTAIPALVLDGEEEYRFRYPQALCDRMREVSEDPGYRILDQFLRNAWRRGRQILVFGA